MHQLESRACTQIVGHSRAFCLHRTVRIYFAVRATSDFIFQLQRRAKTVFGPIKGDAPQPNLRHPTQAPSLGADSGQRGYHG